MFGFLEIERLVRLEDKPPQLCSPVLIPGVHSFKLLSHSVVWLALIFFSWHKHEGNIHLSSCILRTLNSENKLSLDLTFQLSINSVTLSNTPTLSFLCLKSSEAFLLSDPQRPELFPSSSWTEGKIVMSIILPPSSPIHGWLSILALTAVPYGRYIYRRKCKVNMLRTEQININYTKL